jgi:hypothetical protein
MGISSALINLCIQCSLIHFSVGMLSPNQQRLVSNFLVARQQQAMLPPDSVEDEVAQQRAQFTESGQSSREKELLANMGRLEDQLEGYRRLGPSFHKHLEVQAATAQSLKALEAKAKSIEEMAATLWWDSKVLMFFVLLFGVALCSYVSCLHARQNNAQSWPQKFTEFTAAAPKDDPNCEYYDVATSPNLGALAALQDDFAAAAHEDPKCEYFCIDEHGHPRSSLSPTAEERWWIQPSPRSSFSGPCGGKQRSASFSGPSERSASF